MSAAVMIDADELAALRLLARKALAMSEVDAAVPVVAQEADATDDGPEDVAPLSVGVDVQVEEPHPDWYLLSLNSRSMMCRLAAAYPGHVVHTELLSRFRKTEAHPDLEDPIRDPATHVCHVRTALGYDAIETVFEMRTNAKGALVRTGRSLGYRLGRRYAEELGL